MRERPIPFSAPMVLPALDGRKTMTRRVVKPQPPAETPHFRGTIGSYSGAVRPYFFWGRFEGMDARANYLEQPDHDPDLEEDILWPGGDSDGFTCDMFGADSGMLCPFGAAANPFRADGDRLWVREAWRVPGCLDDLSGKEIGEKALDAGYRSPWCPIQYESDGVRNSDRDWHEFGSTPGTQVPGRYRHARFMPRWASRITLEVTGVRVERLQDISEADAIAEGLIRDGDGWRGAPDLPWFASPVAAFHSLWESINGAGSWHANPWVWVVAFRRIEPSAGR